jgi:uncharacterized damage-inducible protein DinB
MKELLEQYASCNSWANERLLSVILTLNEAQQRQHVESSFPSLFSTALHMWDAESTWWQRIKLQEHIDIPSKRSDLSMQDVADGLMNQSRQWEEWVYKAPELLLQHVFAYYNSRKEYFKDPAWKTLLHLFNHGTYHRGQIVTILHHLQVQKIPATDFIAWVRRK